MKKISQPYLSTGKSQLYLYLRRSSLQPLLSFARLGSLFIPVGGGRPFATAEVSSQLDPDQGGPASFPGIAGWCC